MKKLIAHVFFLTLDSFKSDPGHLELPSTGPEGPPTFKTQLHPAQDQPSTTSWRSGFLENSYTTIKAYRFVQNSFLSNVKCLCCKQTAGPVEARKLRVLGEV